MDSRLYLNQIQRVLRRNQYLVLHVLFQLRWAALASMRSALLLVLLPSHFHVLDLVAVSFIVETTLANWNVMLSLV